MIIFLYGKIDRVENKKAKTKTFIKYWIPDGKYESFVLLTQTRCSKVFSGSQQMLE